MQYLTLLSHKTLEGLAAEAELPPPPPPTHTHTLFFFSEDDYSERKSLQFAKLPLPNPGKYCCHCLTILSLLENL